MIMIISFDPDAKKQARFIVNEMGVLITYFHKM